MKYTFNNLMQYHNPYGPAIEMYNGSKFWYINSKRHRVDGPAIECPDGSKYYYIMDKLYSYEEWLSIKDFSLLW